MGRPPLPPGHDKRTRTKTTLRAALVQRRVCKQDHRTASTRYQRQYRLNLLADVANEVSSSSVSSSQPSQGVSSVPSTSSALSDVSDRTVLRRTNCVLKGLMSLDESGQHKLLSRVDTRAVLMHHGWVRAETEETEVPCPKKVHRMKRAQRGRVSLSSPQWKERILTLDVTDWVGIHFLCLLVHKL